MVKKRKIKGTLVFSNSIMEWILSPTFDIFQKLGPSLDPDPYRLQLQRPSTTICVYV